MLGLSPANIAKYGRQVLEALRFLFEKGYVLGMCCVCSSILQFVSQIVIYRCSFEYYSRAICLSSLLDKLVINFRDDQSIICPLQKQLH